MINSNYILNLFQKRNSVLTRFNYTHNFFQTLPFTGLTDMITDQTWFLEMNKEILYNYPNHSIVFHQWIIYLFTLVFIKWNKAKSDLAIKPEIQLYDWNNICSRTLACSHAFIILQKLVDGHLWIKWNIIS